MARELHNLSVGPPPKRMTGRLGDLVSDSPSDGWRVFAVEAAGVAGQTPRLLLIRPAPQPVFLALAVLRHERQRDTPDCIYGFGPVRPADRTLAPPAPIECNGIRLDDSIVSEGGTPFVSASAVAETNRTRIHHVKNKANEAEFAINRCRAGFDD